MTPDKLCLAEPQRLQLLPFTVTPIIESRSPNEHVARTANSQENAKTGENEKFDEPREFIIMGLHKGRFYGRQPSSEH